MKQLYLILVGTLVSTICFGQQPGQYSLYMFNKMAYNPAYAGLDNSISVTGVFRQQWAGLEGAPMQQSVTAHMPLYIARGGFGINVENESIGARQNTLFAGAYNFQMTVGRSGVLSLGLGGGIYQGALDGSLLRTPEGFYQENQLIHNDELLGTTNDQQMSPVFSAGVYFQSESFELGIATSNVTEATLDFSSLNYQLVRNYFLNANYNLDITRSLLLQPSIFVKSDLVQTQIEFSALFEYNGNIFGGASFRGYNSETSDAVAIIGGVKLNEQWTLAYAYDLTLSGLQNVSNGSHEILLNFNLGKIIGKGRPPKIIYNPRNL